MMKRASFWIAATWVVLWLVVGVSALLPTKADSAQTTAKIGIFVDSPDITEAYARQLVSEASIIFEQAGVRLEMDSYRLIKPSLHSNPAYVLDDVIEERAALRDSTEADVHVLLTKRALYIGSSLYAGYATKGPACTIHQSAVVSLIADERPASILAHEVAHTFGVEHDTTAGWLMSAPTRATDQMSPDTLGVIRGSLLDCMVDKPSTVPAAYAQEPAQGGGGGSFQLWFVLALAAFVVMLRIRA
jgi:hypothetical protein